VSDNLAKLFSKACKDASSCGSSPPNKNKKETEANLLELIEKE
jgi:hypothetical protein